MEPDSPVIEERLDLVRRAGAPERLTYLAILGAFDDAKAGYETQLRPPAVAEAVARSTGRTPDDDSVIRALDALTSWGVLEQTFDSSRVGSIAEYRPAPTGVPVHRAG